MRGCAQLSGSDKFNEGAALCRAALRCAAELRIHSEVRMFCVICCKVLRRRVGRGRIYCARRRLEHLSWSQRLLPRHPRIYTPTSPTSVT